MDAPLLPDDPRDWPSDPFALLGVARSVGEADLSCAYTRLIKKYKPEHAPDEFRLIREAYEVAIEMSRWFRESPPMQDTFRDLPFSPPAPAPPQAASEVPHQTEIDPPAPTRADRPSRPHETEIDPPVRPVSIDPVEAAWADALSGHWNDAYSALVELAEQHQHRADLPLRLYWLLALRPTLDDDHTRHDWLVESLTRTQLRGPAVELYRRELAADPESAFSGPYSRLLDLPNVAGRDLLSFAATRLVVATSDGRWSQLDQDLTALEGRASDFDDSTWLAYLVELAGAAAAGDHLGLLCRCRDLMTGLRHLELSHGSVLDRFDEQTLIADRIQAATLIPIAVGRAVTASLQGGQASRKALEGAIAWAADDPAAALRECDVWIMSRRELDVLNVFVQLIQARGESTPNAPYPSTLIRGAVRAFVAGRKKARGADKSFGRKYAHMRPALLLFLLAERIDPEELVTACLVDSHQGTRTIVQNLRDDASMRLVYRTASATP